MYNTWGTVSAAVQCSTTLRVPKSSALPGQLYLPRCAGHYSALFPSGTAVKLSGSLPALNFTIILGNGSSAPPRALLWFCLDCASHPQSEVCLGSTHFNKLIAAFLLLLFFMLQCPQLIFFGKVTWRKGYN